MSIPIPPQGPSSPTGLIETIIAEVLNQAYSANASIFGSPLSPNIPSGQTIEWTIHFAFQGNQAVLEHSIDNGVNFATTFEDITGGVAYSVKIVVTQADQVIFRFSKNGTIIYIRVGEPL